MTSWLAALEALDWVRAVRTSPILYPLLSGLHIFGFALLVGGIAVFDVAALRDPSAASDRAGSVALKVARAGLATAAATGAILFACRATHYVANPAFLAKAAILVLATGNAMAYRRCVALGPGPARACLCLSLVSWAGAVFAGRWIGFV